MDVLLGLDLGTTNCKALAVGLDGQPIASASLPTPARILTGEDRAAPEYDALELWHTSAALIRQVVGNLPGELRVAATAVASMGEAGVLIDGNGAPLTPVLTWHDPRTLPWVDWWRERISDQQVYEITGLPPDYIYSAHKLLWHRSQDPVNFRKGRAWLCLADWVTFRLTGEFTTTYSLASRTMLFDQRSLVWNEDLLGLAGLPASLFPKTFPSGTLIGRVTRTASGETGLPEGLPVVSGGHDHICAALAAGAITPEIILDSAGTVEALMVTLVAPSLRGEMASSGLGCGSHSARGKYYLIGGIMGGGVLAWVSRLLAGDDSPETIGSLMSEAMTVPAGAKGARFIPYLEGNGPPLRDARAWGAWLGLRLQHTRRDLVRACVEGLSLGIRYLLECLQSSSEEPVRELRCVGGGTRNAFWQQIKADVMGVPIDTPAAADITAQGAALLAGIGAGAFKSETEAAASAYRTAVRYVPDSERVAYYEEVYQKEYRELYTLYKQLRLSG